MSAFRLRIDIDNDAFTNDQRAEIARILRYAADRVELNTWGPLIDANGNRVGAYEIET